jgi:hypothetical protein
MKDNYRRLLRVFLLFAFVSLMLCPYAELITASHGGKLLIQQDDFKKNRKLTKHELPSLQIPAFLKTPHPANTPLFLEVHLPLSPPLHQPIGISITTTVQLLL